MDPILLVGLVTIGTINICCGCWCAFRSSDEFSEVPSDDLDAKLLSSHSHELVDLQIAPVPDQLILG